MDDEHIINIYLRRRDPLEVKAALRISRMLNNGVRNLHTCCLRFPYTTERPLLRAVSYRRTRRRRLLATLCSAAATAGKERKEKVIVISGPTGAGKSRLAMELAKRLNGEIISADSVQVNWQCLSLFVAEKMGGKWKPNRSCRFRSMVGCGFFIFEVELIAFAQTNLIRSSFGFRNKLMGLEAGNMT